MLVPVILVLSWAGEHAEDGEGNNLAAEIAGSTGIYDRIVDSQSLDTADVEWSAPSLGR